MIINEPGATFEYEGVTYTIGERIIGTQESEYHGLFGTITEIRDGEDKETENETPDLYCTFEPPVLPCEIQELEKVFSDLYDVPKTIDDIILDFVIMAPTMVQPLKKASPCPSCNVYLVLEDWAIDGECDRSVSMAYTTLEDAKQKLTEDLLEEQENGCIQAWKENDSFVEESSSVFYECYLDGDYCENHFYLTIVTQPLCAPPGFEHELAEKWRTKNEL